MKYCIKCGKEISDGAVFCQHCGEKQTSKTPKQKTNKKYIVNFLISVIIVIGCILFWMYLFPLNNDKDCYDAGKDAHEAIHDLNLWYGHNYECSESCPVCHPITWRWTIRKARMNK